MVTAGDITINSSIRQYFNTGTEHSFYLGKMYVTLSNKDTQGLQRMRMISTVDHDNNTSIFITFDN